MRTHKALNVVLGGNRTQNHQVDIIIIIIIHKDNKDNHDQSIRDISFNYGNRNMR
jgi:hypothetical protein